MSKQKVAVGVRLDPELKDRLQKRAEAEERTLSQEIRKILKEWVEFSEPPKKSEEIADLSE